MFIFAVNGADFGKCFLMGVARMIALPIVALFVVVIALGESVTPYGTNSRAPKDRRPDPPPAPPRPENPYAEKGETIPF